MVSREFLAIHLHTHVLVLRRDHQRLLAHTANHVERLLHLAVPRQRLHIGRHAAFDHGAFLRLDREEAIGRTESVQTLMRPPVVVVLHPPREALPRLVERLETRLIEELVLECLPQPLDLPQRLGMMRRTANMVDVILCHFLLELCLAAPAGILPTVVGQHLSRGTIFADRPAVDFQHALRCVAAIDSQTHDVPGVVIQKGDDIRHFPEDVVVRDVALPHLVRRGTLEPAWWWLPPVTGLGRRFHQSGVEQFLPDLPRTGPHPEPLPQQLCDPADALLGLGGLQRQNRLPHRFRQRLRMRATGRILQPRLTVLPVLSNPLRHHRSGNPDLPGHRLLRKTFLQV